MEAVNCLVCGSTDRTVRYRGSDRMCAVPGTFTLVECACCGFLYLSPRPDERELEAYYPPEYSPFQTVGDNVGRFSRRLIELELRRRSEIVCRYASEGSLLDVGASTGDFLAVMRSSGAWDVFGVEPSRIAVERARQVYGLDIEHGTWSDVIYPPDSFDVVTLWEVLEHLPRPREAVRRVFEQLRPGGYIVMSVPNRDSIDSRLFGSAWSGLDIPRHFSVFRRGDVTRILTDAGFENPQVVTLPGPLGAAHNELLFILISLLMALRQDSDGSRLGRRLRSGVRSALTKTVSRNPVALALLFLATLPYSWTARVLNRATQVVVVARKPPLIGVQRDISSTAPHRLTTRWSAAAVSL